MLLKPLARIHSKGAILKIGHRKIPFETRLERGLLLVQAHGWPSRLFERRAPMTLGINLGYPKSDPNPKLGISQKFVWDIPKQNLGFIWDLFP